MQGKAGAGADGRLLEPRIKDQIVFVDIPIAIVSGLHRRCPKALAGEGHGHIVLSHVDEGDVPV
jgi:hypothetical protein